MRWAVTVAVTVDENVVAIFVHENDAATRGKCAAPPFLYYCCCSVCLSFRTCFALVSHLAHLEIALFPYHTPSWETCALRIRRGEGIALHTGCDIAHGVVDRVIHLWFHLSADSLFNVPRVLVCFVSFHCAPLPALLLPRHARCAGFFALQDVSAVHVH